MAEKVKFQKKLYFIIRVYSLYPIPSGYQVLSNLNISLPTFVEPDQYTLDRTIYMAVSVAVGAMRLSAMMPRPTKG